MRTKLTPTILLAVFLAGLNIKAAAADTVKLRFDQKGGWVSDSPTDWKSAKLEYPDAPHKVVALQLRKPATARSALALRRPAFLGHATMPRLGATPDEIKAALSLARVALATFPAGKESSSFFYQRETEFNSVRRIYQVAGTAADARELVDYCKRKHSHPNIVAGQILPIVAYIEARKGTLGSGQLNSLLGSSVPTLRSHAAVLLKAYGSRSAEPVIVEAMKNPGKAGCAFQTLLSVMIDRPNSAVLTSVRKQFARSVKSWQEAAPQRKAGEQFIYDQVHLPENVLSYLLAHGSKSDHDALSKVPLAPSAIGELIPVVTDPSVLLPVHSSVNGYVSTSQFLAAHAYGLWSHPRAMRDRVVKRGATMVYRQLLKIAPSDVPSDRRGLWAQIYMDKMWTPKISFIRPPANLAFFLNRYDQETSDLEWAAPDKKYLPQLLNQVFTGKSFKIGRGWYQGGIPATLRKLDCIASAEVEKALPSIQAPQNVKALLLAAHRIANGSSCSPRDRNDGDVLRRPYWFRAPGHGALAGVLSVRPDLTEGRLKLTVFLDQTKAIERTMIDVGPDSGFALTRYTENYGKKLVKGARLLKKDGTSIPIEIKTSTKKELFVGSTAVDSIDGAYLVIDFELMGQKHAMTFDLFATRLARQVRTDS